MEKLLSFLKTLPEYQTHLECIQENSSAALTGICQINRSHMIAALHKDTKRPLVLICQDSIACLKLQEELRCFLGLTVPVLPSRELTLYDTCAASREWEQKRLRQLYQLQKGEASLQIIPWDALCRRTVPAEILERATFTLSVGKDYSIDELIEKLNAAGYDISFEKLQKESVGGSFNRAAIAAEIY